MQTFEQYFLEEGKLPKIDYLLQALKEHHVIEYILQAAQQEWGGISSQNMGFEPILVIVFKTFNPYTQQREDVRIVLIFDKMQIFRARADFDHGQNEWEIKINWPIILMDHEETHISIPDLLQRVLDHELTHVADLQVRYIDLPSNATAKQILHDPAEVKAQIRNIISTLKHNLQKKIITKNDIQYYVTRASDKKLVTWLNYIISLDLESLYFYINTPIMKQIRQNIYHEFLA